MTVKDQYNKERLLTSIQKCRIHLTRIQFATNQIKEFFPLTADKYKSLTEANIGNIDQLVFRFTKLQDELGTNTFRFLLECLQEDTIDKPFHDILNILERLHIIDSKDTWLSLRELRNDLTHEYPMMIDETIEKLNLLFFQMPFLENILITIELKGTKYL
jgi:hypothetical protein